MAILILSLPHGSNWFFSHLMAFLCTSWQYYIWPCGLRHICWYDCDFPPACLPCLGSFVLNDHSLALNSPHSNLWHVFFVQLTFLIRLLAMFGIFVPSAHSLAMNAPHGEILLGLMAAPNGSINYFFASRRWSFFLCLKVVSIISLPHGDDQFFQCLTAIWIFFLTSRQWSIFSLPHGGSSHLSGNFKWANPWAPLPHWIFGKLFWHPFSLYHNALLRNL